MSKIDGYKSAFPLSCCENCGHASSDGINVRTYIATQVFAATCGASHLGDDSIAVGGLAKAAAYAADILIAELNKPTTQAGG